MWSWRKLQMWSTLLDQVQTFQRCNQKHIWVEGFLISLSVRRKGKKERNGCCSYKTQTTSSPEAEMTVRRHVWFSAVSTKWGGSAALWTPSANGFKVPCSRYSNKQVQLNIELIKNEWVMLMSEFKSQQLPHNVLKICSHKTKQHFSILAASHSRSDHGSETVSPEGLTPLILHTDIQRSPECQHEPHRLWASSTPPPHPIPSVNTCWKWNKPVTTQAVQSENIWPLRSSLAILFIFHIDRKIFTFNF